MQDAPTVRTRFAPSPTGSPHIGSARTALFNYLYAKATRGKFILRVEDTDRERSTASAEKLVLQALRWLNIEWDEGPEVGGPYAPYRQSERLGTYQSYTQRLLEMGRAYPCFCTDTELKYKSEQAKRLGKAYIYDGKCRGLSDKELAEQKQRSPKYTIRFATDASKKPQVLVSDIVQAKVNFDCRLIGDFIIVKSNGFPSYNYAVVIDDYEMKISHVIRGVGHLSNTSRQILIQEALNMPIPRYAHISEIVGTDRKKLSKRHGATSVLDFKHLGYPASALINYMALLGWHPRDSKEFMSLKELIHGFDIAHCSKSPAMLDFFLQEKAQNDRFENRSLENKEKEEGDAKNRLEEIKKRMNKKSKLNWLGNLHLRQESTEKLWEQLQALKAEEDSIDTKFQAMQERQTKERILQGLDSILPYMHNLKEALPYLYEFFRAPEELCFATTEAQNFWEEGLNSNTRLLSIFQKQLTQSSAQNTEDFRQIMRKVGKEQQLGGKQLYLPIRVASTGDMEGLELPLLFSILGPMNISKRIQSLTGIGV